MTAHGLLIAGTTSDAGKTTLVTGLCRWLARQGVRVAPFKSQNMSNNSMVCAGRGGAPDAEIGRAQWIQAVAAGAEPEAAMNPILLKPSSDHRSHVVAMGRPWGTLGGEDFGSGATRRAALATTAFEAYDDLATRYDVIIAEGAGSPAEINLRTNDFVNMGLARYADAPVIVVGDIDRGGVFAALYGTLALLDADDQRLISAFVVNRFRGTRSLLTPATDSMTEWTGRPVVGVLPWLDDIAVDSEDSLNIADRASGRTAEGDVLTVAVVPFPRISNFTDLDAFAVEPGCRVVYSRDPDVLRGADLAVLPGTRATVDDLAWLRRSGLAEVILERSREGRPVLGICGGYQMLGREIIDRSGVERLGQHRGLDVLPVTTTFAPEKTVARPTATAYEIHHGSVEVDSAAVPYPGGIRDGMTVGTLWHGLFEDDAARTALLTDVAVATGHPERAPAGTTSFAAARERRLDRLADAVDEHLDTDAILCLIEKGAPPDLPSLGPST